MLKNPNLLKIAIPSKGRLKEPAIELMKKAGYKFRQKDRHLFATCTNADIAFVFMRTDDIPVLVSEGVVDLGITGQDIVEERDVQVEDILPLGFGGCRLCVAGRDDVSSTDLKQFEGKTIATSFVNITETFFKKHSVKVKVVELSGSVELMIALGLADGIVDIVETGDSLRDNKLMVYTDIGSYQTSLIGRPGISGDERLEHLLRRLKGILIAKKYSILEFNAPSSELEKVRGIAPGYDAPTVTTIGDGKLSAVKVLCEKKKVVETIDKLEAMGAHAIFETGIDNCRL